MGRQMRRLPCVGGLNHRWLDGVCANCETDWTDRQWYCGPLGCARWAEGPNQYTGEAGVYLGSMGDECYERPVPVAPSFPEWREGVQITQTMVRSTGTCEACLEIHRRNDERSARSAHLTVQTWAQYVASDRRKAASEAMWKEREERWRHERTQRTERRRQRRLLREGRVTMAAIRRVLRGQDPLPRPESTPAKSSRI